MKKTEKASVRLLKFAWIVLLNKSLSLIWNQQL